MTKPEKPAKKLTLGERLRNYLRNDANKRRKRMEDQSKSDEKYREWLEKNKQKSTQPVKTESKEEENENLDQSVYEPDNPKATQEDDMEEDLALLDEEDDLW